MHQTKKGNQWYFGMKVYVGVDTATAAIYARHSVNPHLIEIKEDEHLSQIDYRVSMRPSRFHIAPKYEGINWDRKIEHDKSLIRCKVEHPFHIVKNFFGACKAIYRGMKKNFCKFNTFFDSANLLMCVRAGRQKDFCQSRE